MSEKVRGECDWLGAERMPGAITAGDGLWVVIGWIGAKIVAQDRRCGQCTAGELGSVLGCWCSGAPTVQGNSELKAVWDVGIGFAEEARVGSH